MGVDGVECVALRGERFGEIGIGAGGAAGDENLRLGGEGFQRGLDDRQQGLRDETALALQSPSM